MSTVFQQQGAPLPARIGPKVFADVPSAKELEDAKRAVDNMRRSQGALRTGLIVAAVALLAAIAVIVFLVSQPEPKPPAPLPGDDPAVLKGQIAELQKNLDINRANLTEAQGKLERFAGLPEAEDKFKAAMTSIGAFVTNPTYGNIKARTIADKPTPTRAQWALYELAVTREGRPIWKGEDAAQIKAGIDQQARDLQALLDQINATLAAKRPDRPPCVGPNCN